MIVWVKDVPVFDQDPDEKTVEFIDKYICCELPDENNDPELHEIVSNVQMHTKRPKTQNYVGKLAKCVSLTCLSHHQTKPLFADVYGKPDV